MDNFYIGLVLALVFFVAIGMGYLIRGDKQAVNRRRKPRPRLGKGRRATRFNRG